MMDTPAHKKSLAYRAHKSLGLCARCSNPPVTGKACCQVCIDTMAARKQQAVDEGRCIDCWTVQALPGKRYCETHDLAHQRVGESATWAATGDISAHAAGNIARGRVMPCVWGVGKRRKPGCADDALSQTYQRRHPVCCPRRIRDDAGLCCPRRIRDDAGLCCPRRISEEGPRS